MKGFNGGRQVVYELKCLCDDKAVKAVRGNVVGGGQIAHDRCFGMAGVDVENVTPGHSSSAEATGIAPVSYLQHSPLDQFGVRREEALDVIPIDRLPTVISEFTAHWRKASQRPESDRYQSAGTACKPSGQAAPSRCHDARHDDHPCLWTLTHLPRGCLSQQRQPGRNAR